MDSAQTIGTTSSEKSHEECFDLIIQIVRGEYVGGAAIACRCHEKAVSQAPSSCLDVLLAGARCSSDVLASGNQRDEKSIRQRLNEGLVSIRFGSPKQVIEMSGDNTCRHSSFRLLPDQRIQESGGIGPARDRDNHAAGATYTEATQA